MPKRRRFTEKEVVSIVARQVAKFIYSDGHSAAVIICPICTRPIDDLEIPDIERDHIQPLGLGGEDTPENSQLVHQECHASKTHEEDRPRMHKADRQGGGRGSQYAKRKRRGGSSIPSRPMDGGKASRFKKKMSGEVTRR